MCFSSPEKLRLATASRRVVASLCLPSFMNSSILTCLFPCIRRESYKGPTTSSNIFDVLQEFREGPRIERNRPTECIFQGRLNAFASLLLCKNTIDLNPCEDTEAPDTGTKVQLHSSPVRKCIQRFSLLKNAEGKNIIANVKARPKQDQTQSSGLENCICAASGRPCLLGCLCFVTACKQQTDQSQIQEWKQIGALRPTTIPHAPRHAKCSLRLPKEHLATVSRLSSFMIHELVDSLSLSEKEGRAIRALTRLSSSTFKVSQESRKGTCRNAFSRPAEGIRVAASLQNHDRPEPVRKRQRLFPY